MASKYAVNKVAWLDIDGQKVTYSKIDFGVGVFPYNVQITADGRFGLTVNQGNAGVPDGGAGSVTVIDLKATPPHVVETPSGVVINNKARATFEWSRDSILALLGAIVAGLAASTITGQLPLTVGVMLAGTLGARWAHGLPDQNLRRGPG